MFDRTAYLRVYMKKWRRDNPEKVKAMERRRHLKQLYSVTPEKIDEMFSLQKGKCALCGEDLQRKFNIDHDHKTGLIRGLIHFSCNLLLGHAKDRIDILEKAILYLNKPLQLDRRSN